MGKIIMNICASADSFGAYSENCSYNISKWRDYGKDYNEYLCQCR